MKIRGRALKLGDNVNTDLILPPDFFSLDPARRRMGLLSGLGPDKSSAFDLGDSIVLVGGRNLGCGSSRESTIMALADAGIKAVMAESIARIFYRSAMNKGVPALVAPDGTSMIKDGLELEIDLERNCMAVVEEGGEVELEPIDPYWLEILKAGGITGYLKKL